MSPFSGISSAPQAEPARNARRGVSHQPLYAKLKQDLTRRIRSGAYQANQQLPSTAELMQMYKVSDGTVKRAIRDLVQDGLVYTISGSGSYVADLKQFSPGSASSRVVGVVYGRHPNELIGNLFYSSLLHVIEEEFGAHGLGLELVNMRRFSVAEVVAARRAGAFPALLLMTTLKQEEVAELARFGAATLSLLTEHGPVDGSYCLANDDLAGARTATGHILARGSEHPAAIVVPQKTSYAEARRRGFEEVVRENGLEIDESFIEPGDWTVEGGHLAMRQLLVQHPEIDGVVASNDMMAIGAMGAAFELGRRIPEDLKIIGYDDIEFARLLRPTLSTMNVDRNRFGRRAATILLQLLDRPRQEYQVERIEPRLVIRESTGGL